MRVKILANNAMEFFEREREPHEQIIKRVVKKHFDVDPKSVQRMTIGICNEVYNVDLGDREVIARLSSVDHFLKGTSEHIPLFKELGILVPDVLAEDYSRTDASYAYQFLSKLPGTDIVNVVETLTDAELKEIAGHISDILDKVRTIPTGEKFGLVFGGGYTDMSASWTERMDIWVTETEKFGDQTGVMDDEMRSILHELLEKYRSYFEEVRPVAYFGDMSTKNVMVENGSFAGLVDLDGLTHGDPLEAIGRIRASWPGTHYGEVYTEAVVTKQRLNSEQREIVGVYALLNRISWACENGIQFNQNTSSTLDHEKERRDKETIRFLRGALKRR